MQPATIEPQVDRFSVEYEVYPTLLHMENTGNRTPDILILSPTPHPLGHMLSTSNNVLFPGHNHQWVIIKMKYHQHLRLAGGCDLEKRTFLKWLAWWLAGGYWLFLISVTSKDLSDVSSEMIPFKAIGLNKMC